MNKAQIFLKNNSSNILTIIGTIGVISTAVLSVKATPKAIELIRDAEYKDNKKLTKMEVVQVAWKPYVPAIVSGLATIFCIAGANYLNIKRQQSLMSAYALLDNTFKEYRRRISEEYGEEVDKNITNDIIRKQLESMDNGIYSNTLFFEFNSMRFFEANIHKVLQAECKAKIQFDKFGYLMLNDYYSYLGLDPSPYGEVMGWSRYQINMEHYTDELEFTYERVVMSNGIVCYNIITNVEPSMDYFCF